MFLSRFDGLCLHRYAERQFRTGEHQPPPRKTRQLEPERLKGPKGGAEIEEATEYLLASLDLDDFRIFLERLRKMLAKEAFPD